jgi:hypothetical protein
MNVGPSSKVALIVRGANSSFLEGIFMDLMCPTITLTKFLRVLQDPTGDKGAF